MFNPIRKFYMPDEVVGLKITTDAGPSISSMAELREAIKNAQFEAAALAQKFGETSPQAAQAAKKVAELRDVMADTNSLVEAFNPDRKFAAFSGAINAVTGGFSALTGAMALFGVQSEEVQQTLLKVQAAMAISEGVNNILDGVQAFKNLSAVVQSSTLFIKANAVTTAIASNAMKLFGVSVETTSTSFKVLKGAIAATGIGLLIVALGAAYEAFQNFTTAAQRAADAQKEFNESTLKFAQAGLKAEIEYIDRQQSLQVARAKAQGKSEDEIFAIQQQFQQDKLRSLQRYQNEVGDLDENAANEIKKQETQIQIESYNQQAALNDKKLQQQKQHDEQAKAQREKAIQEQKQQEDDLRAYQQRVVDAQFELNKSAQEVKQAEREAQQQQDAEDQKLLDQYAQQEQDRESNLVQSKIVSENQHTEAVKELAQRRTEARDAEFQAASNLFAAASQLAGQHTAAGKILAIAATTIDTYRSATAAYAGMVSAIPGPVGIAAGIVAAAASIAMGIANVKRILAVKVPGGGSSGSAPSISTAAPLSANIPAQRTSTTVDAASINKLGQASSKSYVLESDVSDNQQRMAMLNRAARIT